MKSHLKLFLNIFTCLVLFAVVIGSAVPVTPAYAAGFTVTKTADTADGTCDADCSLREAIIAANALAGADTITVPAGTYTLTITGTGENAAATGDLDLNSDVTIAGAGANSTFIEAGTIGYPNPSANGIDRVFDVRGTFTVSISGVTIRNGNLLSNEGGGIYHNNGTLTVTNSAFSGNSANEGGGIYHNNGTLTVTNSAFSSNFAGYGAGISTSYNVVTTTVTNSSFSGNSVYYRGGGIEHKSGTLTVTNSTFNGNSAGVGGGVYIYLGALTVTNSTLSGNSAAYNGGGMYSTQSNPTLMNVTFSGNSANNLGGGIYNLASNPTLKNVIIANSISGGDCFNDSSTVNAENSLIEDSANACGLTDGTNGNIIGVDPNLGPLAANSGSTQTHALLAGSVAINAGSNSVCDDNPGPNNLDQRGVTRPQGTTCDVGAFELVDNTPPNTNIDSSPSNPAPTFDAFFTFSGTDADSGVASFECSLDGSAFAACTSGTNFGPISNGTHTFQVRAIDVFGHSDTSPASYIWTTDVYDPPIFADVPFSYWANYWIEILYNDGITGGCATDPHLIYCPDAPVTRAEMAIFILRSEHGGAYTPPPATGTVFTDVSLGSFADAWIEQLAAEGITGGCTVNGTQYCPNDSITRAEMSIFLLRGKYTSAYTPPPATGTVFGDVTLGSFANAWIEQLFNEKITTGCGGGNYCPSSPVTRAEMAVFLVETFNLP